MSVMPSSSRIMLAQDCCRSALKALLSLTPRCAPRFGRASGTPPFGISTGQSVNAFCGPACGLHSLMLDVPLHPFLLGKRLVRDGVISIDVFSSINPQSSKLGNGCPRRNGSAVLLVCLRILCVLGKILNHRFNSNLMLGGGFGLHLFVSRSDN